jgi:hypothetical protein
MTNRAVLGEMLARMNSQQLLDGQHSSQRVSGVLPFGAVHVAENLTIFDMQSTWGVNNRNDVTSASGTGFAVNTSGAIHIGTGASSGGFSRIETAQVGRYSPGKAAEFGVGIRFPNAIPEGGIIRAGLGDTSNAVFWEWNDDGVSLCLKRDGVDISSVGNESWNLNNPPQFNPASQGFILGGQFTWYGYGKITPRIWFANEDRVEGLDEVALHNFQVNTGTSLVDPNLPIFIEVTGAAGTNLELGGRRYSILGSYDPEYRSVGTSRISSITAVGSSWNPLISVRLKSDFPSAGRPQTITAYLDSFDVSVNADSQVAFFEGGVNSGGGTYGAPVWTTSFDHGVEVSIDVTTININSGQAKIVGGPWLAQGGATQGNQPSKFGNLSNGELTFPIVRGREYTLAVKTVAATSVNVVSNLRVQEEW